MKFILNSIFLFFISIPLALAQSFNDTQYSLVFDAGSSGTRAHLFAHSKNISAVPAIEEVFAKTIKPGISSYAKQPEKVSDSIAPLINEVITFLTSKNLSSKDVSLHLFATAGMRLLPPEEQNKIYASLKNYVDSNYTFASTEFKTILGEEEALYDWLDVNYLNQTFQKRLPSIGALDMGGASTQVAFELSKKQQNTIPLAEQTQIVLGNQTYVIYHQSFLGLGQDQARKSMNLSKDAGFCYPSGYTSGEINGNFDLAGCAASYDQVLDDKLKDKTIPSINGKMLAFSGYYYAMNFFGAIEEPSEAKINQHIQSVCKNTWTDLQNLYPTINKDYLSGYCPNGMFQSTLLFKRYGINNDQLTIANEINHKEIDWTVGALLSILSKETPPINNVNSIVSACRANRRPPQVEVTMAYPIEIGQTVLIRYGQKTVASIVGKGQTLLKFELAKQQNLYEPLTAHIAENGWDSNPVTLKSLCF